MVWGMLRAARRAHKSWRSLDPQQRAALAEPARRVRRLAVELGGQTAGRFVEGEVESLPSELETTEPRRPKSVVAAELREAAESLSRACVAPGAQLLGDSAPRSVRIGIGITKIGARYTAPRVQGMRKSGYAELARAIEEPQRPDGS